jgi:two-component system KDP operon response regulator KdpE
VRRGDEQIQLTKLEFRLLEVLLGKKGRPIRSKTLLREVWGRDFAECAHYLRVYIRSLRLKLEQNPQKPRLLQTVRGVGYRLVDPGVETGTRASRAPSPQSDLA